MEQQNGATVMFLAMDCAVAVLFLIQLVGTPVCMVACWRHGRACQ